MAPPPLVLLDEDQHRTLLQQPQRRSSVGRTSSYRMGSFGGIGESMAPQSATSAPRTDFTATATGGSTNTKFNFAPQPRTNFTAASVTRPTSLSAGGQSNDTFSSSPKTAFTSHTYIPDGYDPNDAYRDDLPPMLDGYSDDEDSDAKGLANGYTNRSGLHLSVTYIFVGLVMGVALGVILSTIKVDSITAKWVSVPGDLFLRALKALVIPYVFCSVAVAIGDIVFVGKISVVGLQTFKVFLIMWATTALLGMSIALLFRSTFRLNREYVATPTNAVGFTCANNMLLQQHNDASVMCSGNATALGGVVNEAAFSVVDVNGVYKKSVKRALALMTVSDQILAILYLIVPQNIFQTLANGDLLSTITFAMVLGSVAGRNYFTKTRRVNYLYLTMLQLRNTFFLALEWVIWLTPVAVISIIAGSFATNQDSLHQLGNIYMYVLAIITAAVLQMFVTQPAIIFLLTRCNPYAQMKHMTRAYIFAFGTSSSLATAPVTLACVKKARMCSQSLANFVVSIGACSNLSAMGFYFPIAIIWLAESSGNGEMLTPWRLFAIFLLSILGCAGTPPIPSAGAVLMATVYKTVFGVSDLPSTFPLYLAVDFFVDRIASICDVNDDMLALKVIAENTDETIVGDHLGERE